MTKCEKLTKKLKKQYPNITVEERDSIGFLSGNVDNYEAKLKIGFFAAKTHYFDHIVNNIHVKNLQEIPMRIPSFSDQTLEGKEVDVLVIGGGVIGASILRELSKYNINTLLIDKEEDVGMHASSRNDGNVHVGIDLHHGSLKLDYLQRSTPIYEQMCKDLDVDFIRTGQGIVITEKKLIPLLNLYLRIKAKKNHIPDLEYCNKKRLRELEPNVNEKSQYGVIFHSAGEVNPYELTIAFAENAIQNGAKVSLNTVCLGMEVKNHQIVSVKTNRGTIYPKVVINAAGTFSEDIAKMADDQFFSIHPRKGTDAILDKKVFKYLSRGSISVFHLGSAGGKTHSKGGGVVQTVDQNTLVGPDAYEQPYKEDFGTDIVSIRKIMEKQREIYNNLKYSDIITYFSGIRAATYEEDFVISKGKWTKNIVHAAAIQSPGLTCAPAIAEDIARFTLEELNVEPVIKQSWNPIRKNIIRTRKLNDEERNALIKENPNYGQIICRCEEISKGEIIDALKSPLPATTIDGIKRRVRAGMGRCQGGFCQEHIVEIIAEYQKKTVEEICKKGNGHILVGDIKGDLK